MSRWPQRSWWRPSPCRRRRRAEFCCRRLKAGAAERATRLAVRRGFHGHRGRPRGLQSWPGSGSRRPRPACGRRASFLNIHVLEYTSCNEPLEIYVFLLPGNPLSQAVEAYRDSGEARCPNYPHHLPTPRTLIDQLRDRWADKASESGSQGHSGHSMC